MKKSSLTTRLSLLSLNAASTLLALVVYSTTRQTTWLGHELNRLLPPLSEPIASWQALPSLLLIVWAWSLWRLLGRVNRTGWSVFIAGLLVLEGMQYWIGGLTFDPWDAFVILMAGAVLYPATSGSGRPFIPMQLFLLSSAVAATAACMPYYEWPCNEPVDPDRCVVPRYELWPDAHTDPRFDQEVDAPAVKGGKLYLYQERLFVSQGEMGISVWSVSDPEQPEFEGMLTIVGNTDIAIRDGVLYANSYRDLVTLDLTDPDLAVSRIVEVFPYPEVDYFLPYGYDMKEWVDPSKGLLVGFTTLNGTLLDLNGSPIDEPDAPEAAE